MDSNEIEIAEKIDEFRNKMTGLLNEYAPYLGPQDGDAELRVNNEETVVTDVLVVVNWMDLDSSNSFLHAYPVTDTNPSMLVGMLYRALNLIG